MSSLFFCLIQTCEMSVHLNLPVYVCSCSMCILYSVFCYNFLSFLLYSISDICWIRIALLCLNNHFYFFSSTLMSHYFSLDIFVLCPLPWWRHIIGIKDYPQLWISWLAIFVPIQLQYSLFDCNLDSLVWSIQWDILLYLNQLGFVPPVHSEQSKICC